MYSDQRTKNKKDEKEKFVINKNKLNGRRDNDKTVGRFGEVTLNENSERITNASYRHKNFH